MRSPKPALGAALLAALALALSCGRGAEPAASEPPSVILLETEPAAIAAGGPAEAAGQSLRGEGRAFERRLLAPGESLGEALSALAGEGRIEGLVLLPAPAGAAEAARRAKAERPDLLILALLSADEGLLAESAFDLVVELAPGEGPIREAAGAGFAELARRAARKGARLEGLEDILAALRAAEPGARWSAAYARDPETGLAARNRVIVSAAPRP